MATEQEVIAECKRNVMIITAQAQDMGVHFWELGVVLAAASKSPQAAGDLLHDVPPQLAQFILNAALVTLSGIATQLAHARKEDET